MGRKQIEAEAVYNSLLTNEFVLTKIFRKLTTTTSTPLDNRKTKTTSSTHNGGFSENEAVKSCSVSTVTVLSQLEKWVNQQYTSSDESSIDEDLLDKNDQIRFQEVDGLSTHTLLTAARDKKRTKYTVSEVEEFSTQTISSLVAKEKMEMKPPQKTAIVFGDDSSSDEEPGIKIHVQAEEHRNSSVEKSFNKINVSSPEFANSRVEGNEAPCSDDSFSDEKKGDVEDSASEVEEFSTQTINSPVTKEKTYIKSPQKKAIVSSDDSSSDEEPEIKICVQAEEHTNLSVEKSFNKINVSSPEFEDSRVEDNLSPCSDVRFSDEKKEDVENSVLEVEEFTTQTIYSPVTKEKTEMKPPQKKAIVSSDDSSSDEEPEFRIHVQAEGHPKLSVKKSFNKINESSIEFEDSHVEDDVNVSPLITSDIISSGTTTKYSLIDEIIINTSDEILVPKSSKNHRTSQNKRMYANMENDNGQRSSIEGDTLIESIQFSLRRSKRNKVTFESHSE